MAPLTCAFTSCGRFKAEIIARFSMLRVLRSSPGRPQHSPQQYVVTNSCSGRLKSSAVFSALSTYSAPSTSRRIFRPFSNISFSTWSPLSYRAQRSGPRIFSTPSERAPRCALPRSLRLDHQAGPIFHHFDQLGHVGVRALARCPDRENLPHRASHHHRRAHRLGLFHAQPDIFVEQTDSETKVELAIQNAARNFVHGGRIAAAGCVYP